MNVQNNKKCGRVKVFWWMEIFSAQWFKQAAEKLLFSVAITSPTSKITIGLVPYVLSSFEFCFAYFIPFMPFCQFQFTSMLILFTFIILCNIVSRRLVIHLHSHLLTFISSWKPLSSFLQLVFHLDLNHNNHNCIHVKFWLELRLYSLFWYWDRQNLQLFTKLRVLFSQILENSQESLIGLFWTTPNMHRGVKTIEAYLVN